MKSKSRYIFCLTLLFFYLFDFTLPLIQRSSFLVLLILLINLLFSKQFGRKIALLITDKIVVKLILGYLSIIVFSFLIPIFHGTYDFSFLRTLFSNLIAFITGILLISFISESDQNNLVILLNLIIIAFVIQSIIEVLGLSNSSIRGFIQNFNQGAESSNEKGIGFRSLALSNATVSTLGGLFGMLYIIFFYRILKLNRITYFDILILVVLIVGNFFGGRSGYIGLFLGMSIFLLRKNMRKFILKFLLYSFGSLFLIIAVYRTSLIPASAKKLIDNKVLPFVFEAYYHYEDNEGFETSSTNDLFENHYFPISSKTFFLGDGRFVEKEGSSSTYMHTDAGFMRIILYGGVLLQIFMIYWFFILIKPLRFFGVEERFLYALFFIYTLLFHIKTISFAYATFNNRMIFLVVFLYIINYYFNLENSNLKQSNKVYAKI